MPIDRITRLNALLQKEISLLVETFVRPEVPGALVTVTGVEIASTLRNANVFVSIYGAPGAKTHAMEVLNHKRYLIQENLNHKIILKYTPVLNFKLDETAERADRVMTILKELDLPDDGTPPTPPVPFKAGDPDPNKQPSDE